MKFLDAILTNNSTDDHCKEFVNQGGVQALMKILCLPNLPLDFPSTASCHAVTSVAKSIVALTHEFTVMKDGLVNLRTILDNVESCHKKLKASGGSAILAELASCSNPVQALNDCKATPLIHGLSAIHSHILLFTVLSKTGMVSHQLITPQKFLLSYELNNLQHRSKFLL
jgi:E3 ubiquitin-protein ligase HUWE1